jgi:hypothetical protein
MASRNNLYKGRKAEKTNKEMIHNVVRCGPRLNRIPAAFLPEGKPLRFAPVIA